MSAADCARRSHWIGSQVGKTDPGYGHDGGFAGTPCVPFAVAADCDLLAVIAYQFTAGGTEGGPT